MITNRKKAIRIQNRTKYFNPETTRTHVKFSSPDSYQNRQIKIEGYETRLYYQFKYCDEYNGQTFFYTLTYNDNNMPKYQVGTKFDKELGYKVPDYINCFDYEDLRQLLCGGFRKMLLRKYGTKMKYFCGAELGDGKGSRGMHNNPHYHILFFLEDAQDQRFPYVKIDPKDFRHLVKKYWQGFDENTDGKIDYRCALKGIAREGENCGLVSDFRACMYCAKYVCKDVQLKQSEDKIKSKLGYEYHKKYYRSPITYVLFFKDRIYQLFNTPLNSKHTEWSFSDKELVKTLIPDAQFDLMYDLDKDFNFVPAEFDVSRYVPEILSKYKLWDEYFKFCRDYIEEQIHIGITEFRNRYCNKCRISQGVGDYALQFISDKMNPGVKVPKKKGFKVRPIGLYLYRKLYTEIVEDKKGNKVRVLNDLGQAYKSYHLEQQINKMADKASCHLQLLLQNEDLYEKMKWSDINTNVWMTHSEMKRQINKLLETDNIKNIVKKYAEYKLVYEDRFFKVNIDRHTGMFEFPCLDTCADYKRFLVPTVVGNRRSDFALSNFLEYHGEDYLSYYQHPDFLRYQCIFNVLDMCSDYFFIQGDNKSQREAEEIQATKRFHSQQRLREFYQSFEK